MVIGSLTQATLFALMVIAITTTAYAAPIDLNTWTQEGNPSNGNWIVQDGGNSVLQTINNDPTFFVSPDNFINTTFDGKFKVETASDEQSHKALHSTLILEL